MRESESMCDHVRTPENPGEWECVNTQCVSISTALGFVCHFSLLNGGYPGEGEITEAPNIWRKLRDTLLLGLKINPSLAWVGIGGFQASCRSLSGRLAVSCWPWRLWRLCSHGNSWGPSSWAAFPWTLSPSLPLAEPGSLALSLGLDNQGGKVSIHPPSQGLPVI